MGCQCLKLVVLTKHHTTKVSLLLRDREKRDKRRALFLLSFSIMLQF